MSSNRALTMSCDGQALHATLTTPAPDSSAAQVGLLIVVGGPQYRVGSHRQFVHLARAVASAGHAVMRFDVRGMGDSDGEPRSFEQLDADIGCAVEAFMAHQPNLRGVVLWGLCDGASASLLYVGRQRDARVLGLALANPWVRSETTLAQTQVKHYYWQRLRQREFWAKVLRGQGLLAAASGLLKNVGKAYGAQQSTLRGHGAQPFQTVMARAWHECALPVLLLISGQDQTAQEFLHVAATHPAWRDALQSRQVSRHDLPQADHTFSRQIWRTEVEARTIEWIQKLSSAVVSS